MTCKLCLLSRNVIRLIEQPLSVPRQAKAVMQEYGNKNIEVRREVTERSVDGGNQKD